MGGEATCVAGVTRSRSSTTSHWPGPNTSLKELRSIGAGALPGHALVVLDPQAMLVADVFPCEDGHAQERSLLDQVLETIRSGEVWIADRNFCTTGFLFGIARRGGYFVIRQHRATLARLVGVAAVAAVGDRDRHGVRAGGPPLGRRRRGHAGAAYHGGVGQADP